MNKKRKNRICTQDLIYTFAAAIEIDLLSWAEVTLQIQESVSEAKREMVRFFGQEYLQFHNLLLEAVIRGLHFSPRFVFIQDLTFEQNGRSSSFELLVYEASHLPMKQAALDQLIKKFERRGSSLLAECVSSYRGEILKKLYQIMWEAYVVDNK